METHDLIEKLEKETADLSLDDARLIISEIEKIPNNLLHRLADFLEKEDAVDFAYQEIGHEAGNGAMGINPLKEGKRIFNNMKQDLQSKICAYEPLRLYCEKVETIEGVTTAGLILGGLLAAKTEGIDVVSTAIILSRLGIKRVCHAPWSNHSDV